MIIFGDLAKIGQQVALLDELVHVANFDLAGAACVEAKAYPQTVLIKGVVFYVFAKGDQYFVVNGEVKFGHLISIVRKRYGYAQHLTQAVLVTGIGERTYAGIAKKTLL